MQNPALQFAAIRLATALPVLKNHLRTTAHIDARNHKWIQCEHRCFTVYRTQVFRVVSVLLSVWKRKSVLVETNGRCKNIFLSSQHRGTNIIRCQDFLKLGTGHSVKHRCLNALSPFLAPAKAHIVASLRWLRCCYCLSCSSSYYCTVSRSQFEYDSRYNLISLFFPFHFVYKS